MKLDGGMDWIEYGKEPSGSVRGGEIFWLAEDLLASQEGLCSLQRDTYTT